MIFNKLNAGCGYDLINDEGWLNTDKELRGVQENFRIWNLTDAPNTLEHDLTERFEFILVNHVLCTMNDYLVHQALINLHRCLKPGGTLQVIDMDIRKVFTSYLYGDIGAIPIEEGDIDDRLCLAISGYGTRDSLYTPKRMHTVLESAGFREIRQIGMSDYDTRPQESLIFKATK